MIAFWIGFTLIAFVLLVTLLVLAVLVWMSPFSRQHRGPGACHDRPLAHLAKTSWKGLTHASP
jgi:hypothetical protein